QGRRSLPLVESDGVWVYMPFAKTSGRQLVSFTGSQPSTSLSGRTISWRTTDGHIALAFNGAPLTGPTDASGTSDDPTLDKRGTTVAFGSAGGLGLGAAGVRRVYVRDRFGFLTLVSSGSGSSRKAMVSAKRGVVAFESTSDPITGVDTGISQIWV